AAASERTRRRSCRPRIARRAPAERTRTFPLVTDVRLTSPERVLFPEEGITKGDLFAYYEQVAPVLVPHLRERPFTLKRYPHGIDGEVYFQKQLPRGAPDWIRSRRFTTHPRGGGSPL